MTLRCTKGRNKTGYKDRDILLFRFLIFPTSKLLPSIAAIVFGNIVLASSTRTETSLYRAEK